MNDALAHLSERPWSDYTTSDYSIEQWHNACLIHQHDGPPTSKGQCKLPIKTPNGAVNRNGVYAAAAALAGARGGVNASTEQKSRAAKTLIRMYKEMDKEPPASLTQSNLSIDEFIEHVGVKGMKWGVRKAPKKKSKLSSDAKKVYKFKGKPASSLSDKQLKDINARINLEQQYARMNPTRVARGRNQAQTILATAGIGVAAYNLVTSPAGQALINLGRRTASSS